MRNTCVLLCIAVVLLLSACGYRSSRVEEGMMRFLEAEENLPAGKLYVFQTEPWMENENKQNHFATVLYGGGEYPPALEKVYEGAVYLSYLHPYEIAVFCCKTREATEDIAKLCLSRLESLKGFWKDSDERAIVQNGTVKIVNRYVFLIVSEDAQQDFSALKHIF